MFITSPFNVKKEYYQGKYDKTICTYYIDRVTSEIPNMNRPNLAYNIRDKYKTLWLKKQYCVKDI